MTLSSTWITRKSRPWPATFAVACGVFALGALATTSAGQIGLPESILNPPSGAVSGEDRDAIRRYVDTHKAGLSGDADAISRARRALLTPLRGREVAPAFRVEYAALLVPTLRSLAADKQDQAAINATILAGELATKDAMGVLSLSLKDSRPAVRLVAAQGFARTFTAARTGQPAIVARDALGAIKELETAFLAESDPNVADSIAGAFDAAIRAEPSRLPGVRAEAVKVLAGCAGARARDGKSAALASALARAGESLLDAVNEINPAMQLSPDLLVEAGGLAGDLIAWGIRSDPATLPPERLAELRALLRQAENLYVFSHRKLDPSARPAAAGLGESFGTDTGKFRRDALQILETLTSPSGQYKLKKERFPTR